MTSLNGPIHNVVDQLQPVYMPGENPCIYAVMNNVPLTTSNEISQEQQIVYDNDPVNYSLISNPQSYIHPQQYPNSQIVNQYSSASLTAQHQQQITFSNIPSPTIQPLMAHTNMNQMYN
jgi:hypothetical protein